MQGINALIAPLLYCMSEPEAFWAAKCLLTQTKTYFQSNLIGVHAGCELVSRFLFAADPELSKHLANKNVTMQIAIFSRLMSFYTS